MSQQLSGESAASNVDVFMSGTVFLDIIFTGLAGAPVGGREILSEGMGSSPGGVANLAVATSRLGLSTSLAAAFGGDVYGEYCWNTLAHDERIDLSPSRRFHDWHSPVTVSLAYDDDRAMVTHSHKAPALAGEPVGDPPRSRACFADMGLERDSWLDGAIACGSLVFADIGWDPTEKWDVDELRRKLDGCHAFVPNADEAMALTRTESPGAALQVIRDWVPLAVVTSGSGGAFAADADSGETSWVPGVDVRALDPTGAGDVFLAALLYGTLTEWPLSQRLRFANLAAALSVRSFGGALAAPGWADICDWWLDNKDDRRISRDFGFLDAHLETVDHRVFQRAVATIGFSDLSHDHGRHQP